MGYMKNSLWLPLVTLLSISLQSVADESSDTAVIGGISTGERAETESVVTVSEREFLVKREFKQRMGGRTVTIQEVEPPVIGTELGSTQPKVTQTEELFIPAEIEDHIEPEFIVVTAIVYGSGNKTRSVVTLSHMNKKCVAISRADFRIMSGFFQFKANGRSYNIISHIVDGDAVGKSGSGNKLKTNQKIPPNGFVVTEIDKGNPQLREIMRDLHDLYRAERKDLRTAYESRKQNSAKAKPSEPEKPMTIRFWKRDMKKEGGAK